MKLALKVGAGLLIVLALLVIGVLATLYLNTATPEHPVGFAQAAVKDPQDKPLQVDIWYPTDSQPGLSIIGLSAQKVATNGSIAGRGMPLVVVSHGNRGLASSHSDTALALASAGFVVAAVTHTGDNARDDSYVGTPRWLIDRARHIHLVLEYMLNEWPSHGQIDAAKVGLFGFSAGGFAALVSIGGVPDLAELTRHCTAQPEFASESARTGDESARHANIGVRTPRSRISVRRSPGVGKAKSARFALF